MSSSKTSQSFEDSDNSSFLSGDIASLAASLANYEVILTAEELKTVKQLLEAGLVTRTAAVTKPALQVRLEDAFGE